MAKKTSIITGTSHREEEAIVLNKKKYYVRFRPKHALHVWQNYADNNHKITHTEILSMMKKSPICFQYENNSIFLGKHRNKIYMTCVDFRKDCIEVKTSYICTNPEYINYYNGKN